MWRDRADRLEATDGDRDGRPVFPAPLGGWRDPSNTQADLRDAFTAAGFDWVTTHVFRKTVATLMDHAGLSSRAAADQLGHANTSMTTEVYFGRKVAATRHVLSWRTCPQVTFEGFIPVRRCATCAGERLASSVDVRPNSPWFGARCCTGCCSPPPRLGVSTGIAGP